MNKIYHYFCHIIRKIIMWFASEMSKASTKSRRTNIVSPLVWPIYVPLGSGLTLIGLGIKLHPDVMGNFLIYTGVCVMIIGSIIVLWKYYHQYDKVYKEDRTLLNSEGSNIEHELIRTMGQTGIPLDYKLRLPESEYLQESGRSIINKQEEGNL